MKANILAAICGAVSAVVFLTAAVLLGEWIEFLMWVCK